MKPGVFITIDVECSMGGAWGDENLRPVHPSRAMMGEYGDEQLGVPLICRFLKDCGLAATFFVETFAEEQGNLGQTEPVCHFLLQSGQDIQLHVHPNHKHYGLKQQGKPFPFTDGLADLDPDAQRALLAEGCERLDRWTGRRPVAFRAGNMGANEQSLAQMAAVGLRIDSSYTFPYLGKQCRFRDPQRYNGSKWYGDVLELALSGFEQRRLPGLHPAQPLDLMGTSFEECRDAIRMICGAGADAVVILHSFSLFKVRNYQYDGGRLNRVVARRFRRLCAWLAENASEFPTFTFAQLAAAVAASRYEPRAVPPCRLGNVLRSYVRRAVQLYNRAYWT
jgi:peptidoglycan/xylan/chitin deacetylase (PgdA/CDA1 family)